MSPDLGRFDAGMPTGTAALAVAYATRAASAAGRLTGARFRADPAAVLAHLLLPLLTGDDPGSTPPRPAAGGGWVHADVIPEDADLLATLVASAPSADAEVIAALAQECRLPVTPYRAGPATWDVPAATASWRDARVSAPRDPPRILDMTAMWAGPLCTMLLAEVGAEVNTVEPPARPDGLRASPRQFAVLDRGKHRRAWDLRDAADRDRFEAAVAAADVLVESFSERVLPQLGYGPAALTALNPQLTTVRIRAFPPSSAEASWVAFGRGVHAASGLGVVDGRPAPTVLAYPDPLAGLLASALVLEVLASGGAAAVDVSLGGSIAPLLDRAGQPLGGLDEAAIQELRSATGGVPGPVLVADGPSAT